MVYLYLTGFWQAGGGANGKASDRMWAFRCTAGCGSGQVYKCECWWDHCSVLSGCLLLLSLCSSGLQDLLRLKPPSLLMLELRRRGITQKKTYYIQNTAKA